MLLWKAFTEDYKDRFPGWPLIFILEIFWHYCQDGSRAVDEFLTNQGLPKKQTKKIIKSNEVVTINCPPLCSKCMKLHYPDVPCRKDENNS